jgi:hypothetical protein
VSEEEEKLVSLTVFTPSVSVRSVFQHALQSDRTRLVDIRGVSNVFRVSELFALTYLPDNAALVDIQGVFPLLNALYENNPAQSPLALITNNSVLCFDQQPQWSVNNASLLSFSIAQASLCVCVCVCVCVCLTSVCASGAPAACVHGSC